MREVTINLFRAIADRNEDAFYEALRQNADIYAKNSDGCTPLHMAVFSMQPNMVLALLKAGASVRAFDRYGETPLHYAAFSKQINMVQMLLNAGAIVDAQNIQGSTPLHKALVPLDSESLGLFIQSCVNLVQALLNAGADVNAADYFKTTPLHMAIGNEDLNLVKILFRNGADINIENGQHKTSLDLAKERNNPEIIQFLENTIKCNKAWELSEIDSESYLHWLPEEIVSDTFQLLLFSFNEVHHNIEEHASSEPLLLRSTMRQ